MSTCACSIHSWVDLPQNMSRPAACLGVTCAFLCRADVPGWKCCHSADCELVHCQQVKIMKTWDPTGREGPQTPLPDVVVVHTPKEDDFGVAAGGDKDGQVSKGSSVCEAAWIVVS